MSMISDLVKRLRTEAKSMGTYGTDYMATLLTRSADTIEMLSEKAREPKRGEWIPHKQDNGKTILWKCSECGQIIYSETETDRLEFHKWCSRCGASMREREGE